MPCANLRVVACKGCQEEQAKGAAGDGAHLTIEQRVEALEENQHVIIQRVFPEAKGPSFGYALAETVQNVCVAALLALLAWRAARAVAIAARAAA